MKKLLAVLFLTCVGVALSAAIYSTLPEEPVQDSQEARLRCGGRGGLFQRPIFQRRGRCG